jgi:DNA segregation ATPase FtsK/SpoIIIE, S-DNA-T family
MAQRPEQPASRRPMRGRLRHDAESTEPTVQADRPDPEALRRIKILAVLLAVFAVLLLVALLTYTSKDEANAQLTTRDLMGVVRGDPELRVRFETTHNWLGLLGAVISHWMFSATVGVWSVAFPILMLLWSRDLLRVQRITPRIRKWTVSTVALTIIISSLFSTVQIIEWMPTIDKVLCGSIGQFIAGTLSQFIGTIGSSITLFVALAFVLVFGYDVDPTFVKVALRSVIGKVKDKIAAARSKDGDADEGDDDEDGQERTVDEQGRKILGKGAVLRPRESRSNIDRVEEYIEEDDVEEDGKTLSSTVRILRSGSGKAQPPPTTLKSSRSVEKGADRGPSEPGDEPELPLFLREEDDDHDELEELATKPLTVEVAEGPPAEEEVTLKSTTLYDEEISYKPPPASLLVDERDETQVDDEELTKNAQILQEKLETFRIKIENVTVQPGPVVTQFEFVPASGVKVSQIESLADDIALALKAPAVRIIAPIPGRGTVGIEIPNQHPSIVRFGSIIKSPKYHNPDIKLPIAMGKTVIGEVYCADLTKMPHLLIAGATGKGKSVGINTILASLLYRLHPRDVKFVIIDPKRVEMSLYRELRNHFLAVSPEVDEDIITEPQNAVTVLKAVVEEMQMRYNVLAAAGQRNIQEYNRKVKDGKIKEKGGMTHRPMPYIVVVIDELADLMMTASKEVEEPIVRIAQLARAVGIHCIVATQRPSVDVVTGLIKANFPARISYQVSSRIDSRTILDSSGAEHLIGNGDLLFVPGNAPKPIRMQNAFISTEEIEAICNHIGKQKGYSKPYILPEVNKRSGGGGGGSGDDRDVLFEDAARIFIQLQQASVSTLQRRLKVGYARAARIVDELESAGIVGPPDGSKGRAVLLQSESELEAYL